MKFLKKDFGKSNHKSDSKLHKTISFHDDENEKGKCLSENDDDDMIAIVENVENRKVKSFYICYYKLQIEF
jgi:hypothetical protein